MRGHVKELKTLFGSKDLREIGAEDLQRFIAGMEAKKCDPKTIRNVWITIRLVWSAALAQEYVDGILPKPKLPRALKKRPRYFLLSQVAKIIAASKGECRLFYWLAAEAGLRAGELAGLTWKTSVPRASP